MSQVTIAEIRKPVQNTPALANLVLQEKYSTFHKKPLLQCTAVGPTPEIVPPLVHEVLRSPGQPLDPATRAFMEPRFGHNFSKVRVHTDTKAAESASAVNALAYTVGQNIIFGAGSFAPESYSGRALLAHELIHVLQQKDGIYPWKKNIEIDNSNSMLEQQAKQLARTVIESRSALINSPMQLAEATSLLQRAPTDKEEGKEEHLVGQTSSKRDRAKSGDKSSILGMTDDELNLALEALRQLLGSAAKRGESSLKAKSKQHRETPSGKEKSWISFNVPIDEFLLKSKDLKRELTIRFFQVVFLSKNITLERWIAMRIYKRTGWQVWWPEEKIRHEIKNRLDKGIKAIPYISDSSEDLPFAFQVYHQILSENIQRLEHAYEELRKVHYGEDAILSSLIAHVNGLVSILNGILDIPVAPINLVQTVRGKEGIHFLGRIPKLNYVGEFGQKYGSTMETGVVLGFFVVTSGASSGNLALSKAMISGIPWLARVASGLRVGSISLGPILLKIIKMWLIGGGLSYSGMAAYDLGSAVAALKTGVLISPSGAMRHLTESDASELIEHILLDVIVARGALKSGMSLKGGTKVKPESSKDQAASSKASIKLASNEAAKMEPKPPLHPSVIKDIESRPSAVEKTVLPIPRSLEAAAKSPVIKPTTGSSIGGGDTNKIGVQKPKGHLPLSDMTDDQLRQLLKTSPEVSYELECRYRNKSLDELKKLVKEKGDETAKIILRQRKAELYAAQAGSATLPEEQPIWDRLEDRLLAKRKLVPKNKKSGTMLVGETNMDLQERYLDSGSKLAGEMPDPTYKPPSEFPRAQGHAEQNFFGRLKRAILRQGLDKIKGALVGKKVWALVDQEVCTVCRQDLYGDITKKYVAPGVLKQFSLEFPDLTIEITDWSTGNVWRIKNGKLIP